MREILLAALYAELEEKMKELANLIETYPNATILSEFYSERLEDYNLFMKFTSKISYDTPLYIVSSELRNMEAPARIYGGICSKGAEYFKLTHEVEKEILNYLAPAIKKETQQTESDEMEIDLSMNPDYIDLADLSKNQFSIFEQKYFEQHPQKKEEDESPNPEDEDEKISIFDK